MNVVSWSRAYTAPWKYECSELAKGLHRANALPLTYPKSAPGLQKESMEERLDERCMG